MANSLKRAPVSGALFLLVSLALLMFSSLSAASQAPCAAESIDEYQKVEFVHDGDSLRLKGGEKIRLIGINTPELARGSEPAEPFGIAARDALRALLPVGSRIGVQYGREAQDRHGRTLAHLYFEDGRSVQRWLLEKGYAVAIAIPPNLYNVNCYQQAERFARAKRQGLWRNGGYKPLAATTLQRGDQGFRLVIGRVTAVKRTKKWLWLTLAEKSSLRVAKEDERYFDGGQLQSIVGKEVIARGWLTQRKGRWSMRIRHSSALTIVDHE